MITRGDLKELRKHVIAQSVKLQDSKKCFTWHGLFTHYSDTILSIVDIIDEILKREDNV